MHADNSFSLHRAFGSDISVMQTRAPRMCIPPVTHGISTCFLSIPRCPVHLVCISSISSSSSSSSSVMQTRIHTHQKKTVCQLPRMQLPQNVPKGCIHRERTDKIQRAHAFMRTTEAAACTHSFIHSHQLHSSSSPQYHQRQITSCLCRHLMHHAHVRHCNHRIMHMC